MLSIMIKQIYMLYTTIALLMLSAAGSTSKAASNQDKKPDRVETKTFTDISNVDINNSYGNIVVQETNSKTVTLQIQCFDTEKYKASYTLSASSGVLTVKTIFPKITKGKGPQINYILSLPKSTKLSIKQKYGNTSIDQIETNLDINLMYGNLKVDKIATSSAKIDLKYGDIKIDEAQILNLAISYSNATINKINKLNFSGYYNNVNIDKINSLNITQSAYNTYKIGNLTDLPTANLKYDKLTVDKLETALDVICSYSDIRVGLSTPTVKNIDIKGAYSDIIFNLSPAISASVNTVLTYGNLKVDKSYNQRNVTQTKTNQTIINTTTVGKTTVEPHVKINVVCTYSDVKIK